MMKLPDDLCRQFDAELIKKPYPDNIKHFYKKWLRFYWDFCNKHCHNPFQPASLPLFLKKLEEKRQSEQQRDQARQAIALFYEMHAAFRPAPAHSNKIIKPTRSLSTISPMPPTYHQGVAPEIINSAQTLPAEILIQEEPPQTYVCKKINKDGNKSVKTGTSWVFVYDTLNNEIKIRHYSPKTLKSYRGWVRQLQAFTQSKDYQTLTQQDVVDFLTYLAVEKKLSASSQNQVFNALLFLYKQVLKKEFGEIKGVARAKRKPYIPVVLSREEIDLIFDHLEDPVNLVAKLLYGCGLRLFECLNLRVQCFNFDAGILTVHDGKGKKDRTVPLPQSLVPALKQ